MKNYKKIRKRGQKKEIEEKKKRERFILPRISTCEILEISENFATIKVPFYEEKEIINKNKYTITDYLEKYGNTQIE